VDDKLTITIKDAAKMPPHLPISDGAIASFGKCKLN
jgi:hypothetical protein